ncbi:hypothetical protein JXO59_08335 [candidate division KSB1 bacterium]|nr:hypothetical protein [candidate division KSB1 bacterium]
MVLIGFLASWRPCGGFEKEETQRRGGARGNRLLDYFERKLCVMASLRPCVGFVKEKTQRRGGAREEIITWIILIELFASWRSCDLALVFEMKERKGAEAQGEIV